MLRERHTTKFDRKLRIDWPSGNPYHGFNLIEMRSRSMLQLSTIMPAIMNNPELWSAVLSRDPSRDGSFVFAVRSTGIYCRPSCPARRPRREQVSFFRLPEAAEQAGFRPCRRCHPRGARTSDPQVELIRKICRAIDEQDEERLTLNRLSAEIGLSAHHLQRKFKDVMGISPRQYAD